MEVVKTSRGNGFLTFAVLVNILFSAVSIGFLMRELRLFHGIHVVKRFSATQIDSCFYDHRVLHPSKVLKLIDSYVLLRIFFLSYL